ncbi:hypothetical protein DKX38_019016 [Salix brachista]|uniref:Uncharacterized protein n=1 Tax=Salix brachista TaxID=2182728 RepID=A0A5N5KQB2_9ROSI|nr:hypothetical protein DKX38_019016 [Salix brachista]
MQFACTDHGDTVTTADDAFEFTNRSPSKKSIASVFAELHGALQSEQGSEIGQSDPSILIEDQMKIIQRLKVKFRKLRDNKERDSLKDQLSEANRKIAELENMARAFQAQESFNHKLSNGKKEEDDGKDTEIERLEGEIGIKNSLTDQQSVGKKVIKRFEYRIEAKDDKIRQLEDELAKKAEENQRLKSQLDRKGKEFAKLRNNIRSAYTDMEKAVATLGSAFMFTVKSPPENGNDYSYDLL